jgi:hypothetical protein
VVECNVLYQLNRGQGSQVGGCCQNGAEDTTTAGTTAGAEAVLASGAPGTALKALKTDTKVDAGGLEARPASVSATHKRPCTALVRFLACSPHEPSGTKNQQQQQAENSENRNGRKHHGNAHRDASALDSHRGNQCDQGTIAGGRSKRKCAQLAQDVQLARILQDQLSAELSFKGSGRRIMSRTSVTTSTASSCISAFTRKTLPVGF